MGDFKMTRRSFLGTIAAVTALATPGCDEKDNKATPEGSKTLVEGISEKVDYANLLEELDYNINRLEQIKAQVSTSQDSTYIDRDSCMTEVENIEQEIYTIFIEIFKSKLLEIGKNEFDIESISSIKPENIDYPRVGEPNNLYIRVSYLNNNNELNFIFICGSPSDSLYSGRIILTNPSDEINQLAQVSWIVGEGGNDSVLRSMNLDEACSYVGEYANYVKGLCNSEFSLDRTTNPGNYTLKITPREKSIDVIGDDEGR